MFINNLLKEYENHLINNERKSINTVKSYIADIGHFATFIDEKDINDIKGLQGLNKRNLLEYMQSFQDNVESTYNRRLASLKSFYKFLVDYNYIDKYENCSIDLKSVKQKTKVPVALSLNQVREILEISKRPIASITKSDGTVVYEVSHTRDSLSCTERRNRAILITMLYCGLRANELVNLELDNLHEDKIKVLGKGNKEREIPLHIEAKNAINRWLQCRSIDSKYVFVMSNKDQRVSTSTVNRIVKKYCSLIGVDPETVSSHICRKTYASILGELGVGIRVIQDLIGHSNLATTQRYVAVNGEMKENAVQSLDAFSKNDDKEVHNEKIL